MTWRPHPSCRRLAPSNNFLSSIIELSTPELVTHGNRDDFIYSGNQVGKSYDHSYRQG